MAAAATGAAVIGEAAATGAAVVTGEAAVTGISLILTREVHPALAVQ